MIWRHAIAISTFVGLGIASIGILSHSVYGVESDESAGHNNAIIVYADGSVEEFGWGDGVWEHWACSEEKSCPAGALRHENGNYKGCTKNGSVCSGQCEGCSGSTKKGKFCHPSSNPQDECTKLRQSPMIDCGRPTRGSCIAFQLGTGGGLEPANGCGCAGPMNVVAGSECDVQSCAL